MRARTTGRRPSSGRRPGRFQGNVVAHWRRTDSGPRLDQRTWLCHGIVYEFVTWDHGQMLAYLRGIAPHPSKRHRGYQGQSIQTLEERAGQHAADKPWFDLVDDQPHILWQGFCDGPTLTRIEHKAIRERRGIYNIDQAKDFPTHVPKWTQYEQRWDRDVAADRPLWEPPAKDVQGQAWLEEYKAKHGIHQAPRWQFNLAVWAAAWSLLTVWLGLWWAPVSPRWSGLVAAAVAALVLLWAVKGWWPSRSPRRGSRWVRLRVRGRRWARTRR